MPTMQELRERLTAEQRPSLPENVGERKRKALRINPESAQTTWWYVGMSDPLWG